MGHMENYPWYTVVDGNEGLLQGDFFDSCPIVIPPLEVTVGRVPAEVIEYDVVVMSQSCDLEQRKIDLVLVCPVWPLQEFEARSDFFKSRDGKEALRRGNVPGYHLLNECGIKGFDKGYLVVDFRNVYSVPLDFLTEFGKTTDQRLRLLSPYREHLSQAFARFFMRVGLPIDIPPFK
jgi:hypothetical protein